MRHAVVCHRPAPRVPGACAAGVLLVLLPVLAPGCVDSRPPAAVAPVERAELERRALDLLLHAAESDDPVVACNAIEALAEVAPQAGVPAFRRAVASPAPLVRYAGYVALGQVRACAEPRHLAAGVRDPHPQVRLASAFAACRCGRDGYARVLVQALTDSPEESLRADAAFLLGRLEEPRARKWLRAALHLPANARSNRVTIFIHFALACCGEADSLRQLILLSQGDAPTRTDALLLLARLGHPDSRDALRYRLHSPSEEYDETRLIAARGLGKLGLADGYDLAARLLTFVDPSPPAQPDVPDRTFVVRSLAVHALAEIGDPRALPALRDIAAAGDDPRLQVAACYAICKIARR